MRTEKILFQNRGLADFFRIFICATFPKWDGLDWMGLGWESPGDTRYSATSGAKNSLHNNGDGDDQVAVNGIDYWENFLV